jgi:hypothetical protein
MHSQTQELQRYLDNELGAAEKAHIEKHLAECSTCQTRLTQLQAESEALSRTLQSWTLPPDLTHLKQTLSLPAREVKPQINLGLISWTSGIMIVLLFVMTRAIFLLSNQLNWAINMASLLGVNERFEQFTLNLWSVFLIRPFYIIYLGELGEGIILVLAVILPILIYIISISGIAVLYFNWLSLTFAVGQPNKIRS